MFCRADKQVLKIAEGIWAKHITLIARYIPANRCFPRKNIEVILPKIDHHFLQLPFGVDRTQNPVRRDLWNDLPRGPQVIFLVERRKFLTPFSLFVGCWRICCLIARGLRVVDGCVWLSSVLHFRLTFLSTVKLAN